MKKKIYTTLAAMVLFGLFAGPGWALSSMRCGCCDMVRNGDSALKVLECFGDPEFVTYISEIVCANDPTQSVQLEYWFYHRDDWVYRITIFDGVVNDIRNIGRD